MKNIFKRFFSVWMIVLIISGVAIFSNSVNAAENLDEIQDYVMTVQMRDDGTMDITYYIDWLVLDSTSEGPLEWVKIGIPNKHVDSITALSNNIKKIGYMSESDGSYVRIDFDRKYMAQEQVQYSFTIHQSYMYILEQDNNICRYAFTPGWFDKIQVKHIEVRWNADGVIESTASERNGDYLIWEKTDLKEGERLSTSVRYSYDRFATDESHQYVNDHDKSLGVQKEGADIVIIIIFIILGTIVVIFILALIADIVDGDDYHGGFGGGGGTHITHVSSCACVRSSCACAHSCACACACAGGGRAGCTKKDFYKENPSREKSNGLSFEIIIDVLEDPNT